MNAVATRSVEEVGREGRSARLGSARLCSTQKFSKILKKGGGSTAATPVAPLLVEEVGREGRSGGSVGKVESTLVLRSPFEVLCLNKKQLLASVGCEVSTHLK